MMIYAELVSRERDVQLNSKSIWQASGNCRKNGRRPDEKILSGSRASEQTSVIDGESRIGDVVVKASKDAGLEVALTEFVRFNLGEGIEREETDFAADVAAQLS